MRYLGQGYELLVPVESAARDPAALAEQFHRRYERAYGYRDEQPVQIVTWHVALVRDGGARSGGAQRTERAKPRRTSRRRAYFPETGLVDVDVHDRACLSTGDIVHGPCLVAETTTTTVVLPGDRVEVASDGSLLVHIGAA
jgi:N-methylhydantoinase A